MSYSCNVRSEQQKQDVRTSGLVNWYKSLAHFDVSSRRTNARQGLTRRALALPLVEVASEVVAAAKRLARALARLSLVTMSTVVTEVNEVESLSSALSSLSS